MYLAALSLFIALMTTRHLLSESYRDSSLFLAVVTCLGLTALAYITLLTLRRRISLTIEKLNLNEGTKARFMRCEPLTYGIFLAFAFVLLGVKANLAFVLLLLVLFALSQLAALWGAADKPQRDRWLSSLDALPLLFFLSGFAALIYQVVWQRVLFATFGINIESVTLIVSVFLLGLGVGALAGGWVQKRYPHRLLEFFMLAELAIAAFGVISIPLIQAAGQLAHPTLLSLLAIVYALLAFPTLLMGATLPLLAAYVQRYFRNLGKTIGVLYAYNTFGSALASFLTVYLLFVVCGRQGTIDVAVGCNVITAFSVFVLKRRGNKNIEATVAPDESPPIQESISLPAALLLSTLVGYVSLSLEILWMRIVGFMTASVPQVFGLLLAVFLAGIAKGSLEAKAWCESDEDLRDRIFRSLFCLLICTYLSLPAVSGVSYFLGKPAGIITALLSVFLVAYFSGAILPALCHMGIVRSPRTQPGSMTAWMYFLNIIGSTLGTLVTGFVLLNYFTLGQNMAIVCLELLMLLVAMLAGMQWPAKPSLLRRAAMGAIAIGALCGFPVLCSHVLEHLQNGEVVDATFVHVKENRSGIVTVFAQPNGDAIYGNGAYDGRFNIDPVNNSNLITRAYMLAALHPRPERVLEIGMSGGAWARVIAMYRLLKQLTSVEINPGYALITRHYPDVAPILTSPRVLLQTDDGRRWLNLHPDERFDVIVMNTVLFWRSNSTNLLSREFLELCKRHLNPGGIVYYNTTEARDNVYTAAHVFSHVTMYMNFVAAGDAPFNLDYETRRQNLLKFIGADGKPIFANPDPRYGQLLDALAHTPLDDIHDRVLHENQWWLITDDNMAPEFRIQHHFLSPSLDYALFGKTP